ncbi:hypothetical protein QZH41_016024, partial [Actinostola sp. cb2023]
PSNPASMAQRFHIFVRFNSSTNIPVQVDVSWNIRQFKQEIAKQQNVDPSGIRIIFAGRELKDDVTLGDCEIPNQSIIHAIHGGTLGLSVDATTVPLSKIALNDEDTAEGPHPIDSAPGPGPGKSVHYYVYCRQCKSVQPGKLRVRCSTCKEGTLVLNQASLRLIVNERVSDPQGWDDVLHAGRIKGVCQKGGCHGKTAEFYFKCGSHPSSEDERSVALYLIRTNIRNVPCLACDEIMDPVLVFPCDVGHAICLECFGLYCTTRLNDRQFVQTEDYGYTLPCPGNTGRQLYERVDRRVSSLSSTGTTAGIFIFDYSTSATRSLVPRSTYFRRVEFFVLDVDVGWVCFQRQEQGLSGVREVVEESSAVSVKTRMNEGTDVKDSKHRRLKRHVKVVIKCPRIVLAEHAGSRRIRKLVILFSKSAKLVHAAMYKRKKVEAATTWHVLDASMSGAGCAVFNGIKNAKAITGFYRKDDSDRNSCTACITK